MCGSIGCQSEVGSATPTGPTWTPKTTSSGSVKPRRLQTPTTQHMRLRANEQMKTLYNKVFAEKTKTADEILTYGECAYEAYRFHQDGKSYSGQPIPPWYAVREDIKSAWEAAANQVLALYDKKRERPDYETAKNVIAEERRDA